MITLRSVPAWNRPGLTGPGLCPPRHARKHERRSDRGPGNAGCPRQHLAAGKRALPEVCVAYWALTDPGVPDGLEVLLDAR